MCVVCAALEELEGLSFNPLFEIPQGEIAVYIPMPRIFQSSF